ncbi:hypothetical protein QTP86_025047 [Hemibagrus guttatus]|nr:hypothetical protein QTP86_025047 [Hemibagrus guttatus]
MKFVLTIRMVKFGNVLRRMPFLTQPSLFIRAWDRHRSHWTTIRVILHTTILCCLHYFLHYTTGAHTVQWTYSCHLDDDNTGGNLQYVYDGKDFMSLNFTSATWITSHFIKTKWDVDGKLAASWKHYLETECIYWLKKVMNCSREILERKVFPNMVVFQKQPSSPEVVCHATGFFPKAVNITWRKDGEDVNEDVEVRETLPNQDGSFQKRSILKVPAEELQKHNYTCVIQHSSLEEELVLNVGERRILSDTHILQYLYTAITPGINVTAVGLLDGEQCVSYDCKTKKMIPKIEWIQKISADEPHYWNIQTQIVKNHQEHLHNIVDTVMRNWNQNKGVHTLQRMYGCELHDDSTTRGYDQYGYDGEDFISLDLNTGTWTADNDKAVIFIKQWDPTGDEAQYWKDYLKNDCIEQLKKFVSYSRETLKKKDPPTASVLQKHSPSPEVVCHATGFFPKAVNISWRKDGEDVNEDVELRETLPNQDGSFQKRSILKVPAEELQKHNYTCVIQHSSLEEELVLNVGERRILSGWRNTFL